MLEQAGLQTNLLQTGIASAFAVTILLLLAIVLKAGGRNWMVALALVLPVVLVYLNFAYRETAYHGFLHASYIYTIAKHGIPPEDPLLAGQPLQYPYLHHWLLAQLMRWVPITPGLGFAVTNILALAGTVLLVYHAASLLDDRPRFCMLAVLLALSGGPLLGGPAVGVLHRLGVPREIRHIPYLKFTVFGSNQFGFLFYALALFGVLSYLHRPSRRAFLWFVIGLVGAGMFYAFSWLVIVLSTGVLIVRLLFGGNARHRKHALLLGIGVILGSLPSLPYIASLSFGRAHGTGLSVLSSTGQVGRSLIIGFLALGPPGLLLWIERARVTEWWRRRPKMMELLVLWAATASLMSVLIHAPVNDEYKLLAHGLFPLGILAAIAIDGLYGRRPMTTVALLYLAILPSAWQLGTVVRTGWPVAEPIYATGPYLRATNANEDSLYSWITANTPSDAVFVDTYLTIPALGRRSLYVALDVHREQLLVQMPNTLTVLNGWSLDAGTLLIAVGGHSPELVRRRQEVARDLLSPDRLPPSSCFLGALRQTVGARATYVVAREATVRNRLRRSKALREVYHGEESWLFRVRSPPVNCNEDQQP